MESLHALVLVPRAIIPCLEKRVVQLARQGIINLQLALRAVLPVPSEVTNPVMGLPAVQVALLDSTSQARASLSV